MVWLAGKIYTTIANFATVENYSVVAKFATTE